MWVVLIIDKDNIIFFLFFIMCARPRAPSLASQPKGNGEGGALRFWLRLPPRKPFFKERLDPKKTLRGLCQKPNGRVFGEVSEAVQWKAVLAQFLILQ